eukprot:6950653-Karenia_brevis.AAC.1
MSKCTEKLCMYGKKLTQRGKRSEEEVNEEGFGEPPAREGGGPSSSSASGNVIETKPASREPSPR